MKLFVTGDNHIGRKFDKYSIKNQLIESRFLCLKDMIETAEKEQCEFFVITGDLFDNTYAITKKDVKRVVEILAGFNQNVLVLPGNHDFYSGNEQLWNDFMTWQMRIAILLYLMNISRMNLIVVMDRLFFILLIAIVSIVTLIAWIG